MGEGGITIISFYSKLDDGFWSIPKKVDFAHEFDNSDPHLSHNDNRMYYIFQSTYRKRFFGQPLVRGWGFEKQLLEKSRATRFHRKFLTPRIFSENYIEW
jgi:hypothetical protein